MPEMGFSPSAAHTPPKIRKTRNKIINACDPCKQRKIKCGHERPVCSSCNLRKVDCTWNRADASGPKRKSRSALPSSETDSFEDGADGASDEDLPPGLTAQPLSGLSSYDVGEKLRDFDSVLMPDYRVAETRDWSRNETRDWLAQWLNSDAVPNYKLGAGAVFGKPGSLSDYLPVRKFDDYAEVEYLAQQHAPFSLSWLPGPEQAEALLEFYLRDHNWFFEVMSPEMQTHLIAAMRNPPQARDTVDRITLYTYGLALCRTALASVPREVAQSLGYTDENGFRKLILELWCMYTVSRLRDAGFLRAPTLYGLAALQTVTSTFYFETDFGFTGGSRRIRALRSLINKTALLMHLDQDPQGMTLEDDVRRRLWWTIVTVDAHFASTGSDWDDVIDLDLATTRIPRSPVWSRYPGPTRWLEADSRIDLRSSETRFIQGYLNNQALKLLSKKNPPSLLADILEFDRTIRAWEGRVMDDQQLRVRSGGFDEDSLAQRRMPLDETLIKAQRVAYICFWHIRARIFRWSGFDDGAFLDASPDQPPVIVTECCTRLLQLHSTGHVSAPFTCAIAQGAMSLLLKLYEAPFSFDAPGIRQRLVAFKDDLLTKRSPILQRAGAFMSEIQALIDLKVQAEALAQAQHTQSIAAYPAPSTFLDQTFFESPISLGMVGPPALEATAPRQLLPAALSFSPESLAGPGYAAAPGSASHYGCGTPPNHMLQSLLDTGGVDAFDQASWAQIPPGEAHRGWSLDSYTGGTSGGASAGYPGGSSGGASASY